MCIWVLRGGLVARWRRRDDGGVGVVGKCSGVRLCSSGGFFYSQAGKMQCSFAEFLASADELVEAPDTPPILGLLRLVLSDKPVVLSLSMKFLTTCTLC